MQEEKSFCRKQKLNLSWTDSFAITASSTGLLVCLICGKQVANNKKSNVERRSMNKYNAFAKTHPAANERKRAISKLLWKVGQSRTFLKKWKNFTTSSTSASFVQRER